MNTINLTGFINPEDNLNKGGLPEGTIKNWKGGNFIKKNGKWIPYNKSQFKKISFDKEKINFEPILDRRSNPKINLNNIKFLSQELKKEGIISDLYEDEYGKHFIKVNLPNPITLSFDSYSYDIYEMERDKQLTINNNKFLDFFEEKSKNNSNLNHKPQDFIKIIKEYDKKNKEEEEKWSLGTNADKYIYNFLKRTEKEMGYGEDESMYPTSFEDYINKVIPQVKKTNDYKGLDDIYILNTIKLIKHLANLKIKNPLISDKKLIEETNKFWEQFNSQY